LRSDWLIPVQSQYFSKTRQAKNVLNFLNNRKAANYYIIIIIIAYPKMMGRNRNRPSYIHISIQKLDRPTSRYIIVMTMSRRTIFSLLYISLLATTKTTMSIKSQD